MCLLCGEAAFSLVCDSRDCVAQWVRQSQMPTSPSQRTMSRQALTMSDPLPRLSGRERVSLPLTPSQHTAVESVRHRGGELLQGGSPRFGFQLQLSAPKNHPRGLKMWGSVGKVLTTQHARGPASQPQHHVPALNVLTFGR